MILQKALYYIIPINLICDVLLIVTKSVAYIKAAFMILLLVHLLIRYSGKHGPYGWTLVFGFYALTIALISTDLPASLLNTVKIVIPIISLLIGYHFINTKEKIREFAKSMNWVLLIIIVNAIISTIFGLGSSRYTAEDEEEVFYMGQLSDHWNMLTYAILFVPITLHFQSKKGKRITILLAASNAFLVLVSIKRIAILGLIGGGAIIAGMTADIRKILRMVFTGAAILLLSYPLYGDLLEERFSARSDRFEDGALQKESRYLETFYVWGDALSLEPLDKSLFGMEAFNSAGTYADGIFGDRQLHVDYNNIVNTIGLFGLIIYLVMFIQLWRRFQLSLQGMVLLDPFDKLMKATFYAFFYMQFITSVAGQMYNITFRLIVFVFLGASMGYFNHLKHQQIEGTNCKFEN